MPAQRQQTVLVRSLIRIFIFPVGILTRPLVQYADGGRVQFAVNTSVPDPLRFIVPKRTQGIVVSSEVQTSRAVGKLSFELPANGI